MARTLAIGIVFCVLLQGQLSADSSAPLTVRGEARPSFQIAPLVQRLSARPGQRLKFSFDVRVFDQPQSLRIRAVRLKQQLNGLMVADESEAPLENIELSGPVQLDLRAEQTATIHGHVDVPHSQAPFHAYGILVTDLGRPLQGGRPTGRGEAGIAVRFVTQYLLRVEVDVRGARPENAKQLRVEAARLVEREGHPVVEAEVANPTASGVEFQLYCRLLNADGSQCVRSFGLALPSRASRPEPQRWESLVFQQSRVRLSAPVGEPVFPGEYRLELEWISQSRKCGKTELAVSVREGDFPAQSARYADVAGVISAAPSQIELSQARGGHRRLPLTLSNRSPNPLQIRLLAQDPNGADADWVLLQPSEFTLPARRSRNVLLTAQPRQEMDRHRYGWLRVEVSDGQSILGSRHLPLALLTAAPVESSLVGGALRWDGDSIPTALVLPVHNRGPVHLPLNGRLSLVNASGQRLDVPGGFGRWLLPGERYDIRFPIQAALAPGVYAVRGQLQVAEKEQLMIDQEVEVQ